MSPESLHAWFRVAIFITIVSAVLVFLQQPGSAEFVISVASLVVGIVFIGVIVLLVRRANR